MVSRRLKQNLLDRIILPFLRHDDYPWMGSGDRGYINNWTVWTTGNILTTAVLLEQAGNDDIAVCEVVDKIKPLLSRFMDTVPEDGSYPEGISYWGVVTGSLATLAYLFDGLGVKDAYDFTDRKTSNLMEYLVKMHIDGDRFMNAGDAECHQKLQPQCMYTIAKWIVNDKVLQFACAQRDPQSPLDWTELCFRPFMGIHSLLKQKDFLEEPEQTAPYPRSAWFSGVEVLCERQRQGSAEGMFLSVKAGSNYVSHAHLDVGSFTVYSDGKPAVIDLGRGQYNMKMFGPNRHEIFAVCSENHNVPVIAGYGQKTDRISRNRAEMANYRAHGTVYTENGDVSRFETVLTDVYDKDCPAEEWKRRIVFDHGRERITVSDIFRMKEGYVAGEDTFSNIMCAEKPTAEGAKVEIPVSGGRTLIAAGSDNLRAVIEPVDLKEDPDLEAVWGECVWRVRFCLCGSASEGEFSVSFTQKQTGGLSDKKD